MGKRVQLPSEWRQPQIITDYLREKELWGLRESTRKTNASVLNWLQLWLQVTYGIGLLDAGYDELRAWRQVLTVSDPSISIYVGIVKAFYLWASREEYIPRDPAWKIPSPRPRRRKPRAISHQDVLMAIINAPKRIRIWLVLAAFAGLRASDIAGLEGRDLYLDDEHPHLMIGDYSKGGHERSVPLSPFVVRELLAYGLPTRGRLFLRPDGKPNTRQGVSNLTNTYLHSLGIEKTLHSLRHYFGTKSNNAEADLVSLQAVMGHAKIDTTALYAQVNLPKAHAMVAKIQPNPWPPLPDGY